MLTLTLFFTCILLLTLTCKRASAGLSAGTAKVDITPDPGMINWVHGTPYNGVLDPLAGRALVLTDGDTTAAFLCLDIIDAVEEAVANARKAVHESTGIPEKNILFAASHTHSGPRAPFTASTFRHSRSSDRMQTLLNDPIYQAWCEKLPETCANIVKQAQSALQPVSLSLGRANAAEWLFNRRPIDENGNVVSTLHPENPYALPDGLRFGIVDPTLTLLSLNGTDGKAVATLFSVPCHSVSIYPHHEGISADWPGPACNHISEALGGETCFLQGCAGDIVPARRGEEARTQMARFFADRAIAAAKCARPLPEASLKVTSNTVGLPLLPNRREETGTDFHPVEIQIISCGPFALVTLPGEPLNGLAREIVARSPFPHTLVIGYTNGRGVGYIGLPGEKAKGGYEAGAGR
ncbi:MAG: neutral/alkaline non-lysosomal ceramidase N-terminal domain-containing protein, partial [bacterium]|nr:neutral/alkaline non-lysosomal ceramidase N-terminal domain-containing protein [bacterium]